MSRLTSALPTPTIFKVYVYDTHLKISLGIYVPALNDSEPADHLKWINKKLKFYVSYAMSTRIIDKIASREISIFESMNYSSTKLGKYRKANTNIATATFNSYKEFSFDFGTDYDQWNQKIYDTNDAITYLYTAEVEIDYDSTDHALTIYDLDSGHNNLTLYAFSSAVDSITGTPKFIETDESDPSLGYYANIPSLPLPLLLRQTSDIGYESVIKDGKIDNGTKIGYYDSSMSPYDNTPLQDLGAEYFTQGKITPEIIIEKIKSITDQSNLTSDTGKSIVESISYVLETDKDSPDILAKLNVLRKLFPSRGGGSEIGRFYDSFTKAIFQLNRGIKSGTPLAKKLTQQDVVMDLRSTASSNEYNIQNEDDENLLFADAQITRQIYGDEQSADSTSNALNWGYIYCDFEKIMKKKTALSQVFDVRKVESWFGGAKFTNAGLKIDYVQLQKYDSTVSLLQTELYTDYTGGFISKIGDARVTAVGASTGAGIDESSNGGAYLEVNTSRGGTQLTYQGLGKVEAVGASTGASSNGGAYLEVNTSRGGTQLTYQGPGSAGPMGKSLEDLRYSGAPVSTNDDGRGENSTNRVTATHIQYQGSGQADSTWADLWYTGEPVASTVTSNAQEAAATIPMTTTGIAGGIDYSYIALRSINMANKSGLYSSVFDHDYRLMAFEFQDYYNADISYGEIDSPTDNVYKATIQFSDNTIELVKAIIQSYSNMMDLFNDYQDEAADNCNYGNVLEQFNPHFITAMTERYADDPNSAPWVQAPLIFAMHRDLLYNDFGGDKQKMIDYAAEQSIKISPASATLSDIQNFYIDPIETLWDDYYSSNGTIGALIASVGEDEKKILLTQEYNNLPEVQIGNSVSEYYEEEEEDETDGTWIKDNAYVGELYKWNFSSTESRQLLHKLMSKWSDWAPELITAYNNRSVATNKEEAQANVTDAARKAVTEAPNNWINAAENAAKKRVWEAAADWAEAHDALDNNTEHAKGTEVLLYAPDYIDDGANTKYRVAVINVDDPDSYDTIRVYRWDLK